MKKLPIFLVLTILALSGISYAQSADKGTTTGGNTAVITVKGLVCEFCVKAIEKVFIKQPEVESVSIDLGKAAVTIVFKQGQALDDAKIKVFVKDAGYDVDEIKRP